MLAKSRLDKTITGLRNAIERYGRQDVIKIDQDRIVINYAGSSMWGTIIFLIMAVFYPISILIYYLFFDNPNNAAVFLLTIIIGWMTFDVFKILRVSNILTLDLKNNYLKVENSNRIFKRIFPSIKIEFNFIDKVELIDRKMDADNDTIWRNLYLYDKRKNKILLTSFNGNFPDGAIASHVKLLFEVIIWAKKKL